MSIEIRYSDDTTLVSAVFDTLQMSTMELETACRKWCLKINPLKCAVMSSSSDNIEIDNKTVPKVDEFKFLGSMIPDCSQDMQHKITLASMAFGRLRNKVWTSRDLCKALKIRLYKALILPIAIYGSESWTMKTEDANALLVFEMKCLRVIHGVTKRDRQSNNHIREALHMMKTIEDLVSNRQLRWFGHVV
ncbi:hypothetical protein Pcinc_017390 [Petrolisthes cinctipes]|uniref:Reverse transcriptase domain-containing protein n=1 Tax=Petrolisthes cinctipes TaxID=88211 RepID=A0AAE1FRJ3_PETCI|nr:hypothetical protein Pcinc_017390 [Petrolisthes cinctipes]